MRVERVGAVLSLSCVVACAQSFSLEEPADTDTEGGDLTKGDDPKSPGGGTGGDAESGTTGKQNDTSFQSGGLGSSDGSSGGSEGGTAEPVCGDGIEIYEDDSMAICKPSSTTTERVIECLCTYDPPLLDPAPRPLDASDPLYYVNRWYSIDPCFPFNPPSALLAEVRETYLNAVDDLEPELLTQCGDYDVEFVQLPPAYTNDNDQLLAFAWSSPAPADYAETLQGDPVGFDGRVGFEPMFQAAAQAGIGLFVQSGFRSMRTQSDLFEYYAGVEGDPALAAVYSAWPAHSEHQLGTTADVGYVVNGQQISPFGPLEADLHASEAFQWIRANAHRFGIVTTYQPRRVHVHQYKPEPWHLRYVGVEAADLMVSCGLSTEELLSQRYRITPLPEFVNMDLVYDAVLEGGWDPESCLE